MMPHPKSCATPIGIWPDDSTLIGWSTRPSEPGQPNGWLKLTRLGGCWATWVDGRPMTGLVGRPRHLAAPRRDLRWMTVLMDDRAIHSTGSRYRRLPGVHCGSGRWCWPSR